MEENAARISGKYVIISAVIAAIALLIGTFGGIWYQSTKTENIQVDLHLKQEEVDQLTQDKQELQTDNTELEQKVLELQTLLGMVQGEQDSIKENSTQLQKQYDELKMQYSEITAQNNAIKVQLDKMGIDIPQTKDSPEENSNLESDSVWVSNLDYLDSTGSWDIGNVSKSNTGTEYSHSLNSKDVEHFGSNEYYREYKIYGQYSKITGYFYQEYDHRTHEGSTTLHFYSDDRTLLNKETLTVSRGSDPIYFEVNVTGVNNLTIEVDGNTGCSSLGEVALWK